MKEISVDELNDLRNENADFQLIDVREAHEYALGNINGDHIPMNSVPENLNKISKDKQVVVMCRSGKRSANVVNYLEQNGYTNVVNLEGGIIAWSQEIDSSVQFD